jgi:hypothetical protein
LEVVEEHLGGVVVDHCLDRPDLDTVAQVLTQIDEKHGEPVGAPLDFIDRGRAREQQHQVGVAGARGPHLLPGWHVDRPMQRLDAAPWPNAVP